MKILERGKAHKANVAYFECNFCGSKFKAIEGDPRVFLDQIDDGDDNEWRVRAICPVCNSRIDDTLYDRVFPELLTRDEKEEMKHWKEETLDDLSDEDLLFLDTDDSKRVYKDRHTQVFWD